MCCQIPKPVKLFLFIRGRISLLLILILEGQILMISVPQETLIILVFLKAFSGWKNPKEN